LHFVSPSSLLAFVFLPGVLLQPKAKIKSHTRRPLLVKTSFGVVALDELRSRSISLTLSLSSLNQHEIRQPTLNPRLHSPTPAPTSVGSSTGAAAAASVACRSACCAPSAATGRSPRARTRSPRARIIAATRLVSAAAAVSWPSPALRVIAGAAAGRLRGGSGSESGL
jgi:hypothetical protein